MAVLASRAHPTHQETLKVREQTAHHEMDIYGDILIYYD